MSESKKKNVLFTAPVEQAGHVDVLYLFACRLRWLRYGDEKAYHELLQASQNGDGKTRVVAETFLCELRSGEEANNLFRGECRQ